MGRGNNNVLYQPVSSLRVPAHQLPSNAPAWLQDWGTEMELTRPQIKHLRSLISRVPSEDAFDSLHRAINADRLRWTAVPAAKSIGLSDVRDELVSIIRDLANASAPDAKPQLAAKALEDGQNYLNSLQRRKSSEEEPSNKATLTQAIDIGEWAFDIDAQGNAGRSESTAMSVLHSYTGQDPDLLAEEEYSRMSKELGLLLVCS